jgi:lipoprotein NlpI
MKNNRIARGLATAVMLIAAGAAQGQTDAQRCANSRGDPDLRIQHCTRAIESGRLSGEPLAKMHYHRGSEWAAKGVYDRAIDDYDAAIRLNPKFNDAHYGRGNAWAGKGESDKAIADYDAAIGLNPREPSAYIGRAMELTVKGDYARAIADYDAAIALDDKSEISFLGRGRARYYIGDYARSASDLEQSLKLYSNGYTALWLYLARKRGGVANAEELLDSDTLQHRGGGWPSTVIVLYLGRTDTDSVLAAATDNDPRRQLAQRCEASFYLAQWHLLRGERERALPLLKEAQIECPKDFLEREGAVAELRRLQPR